MSNGDGSLYAYSGTEHPTGLSYALGTYTNPFTGVGLDVWNAVLDGIRRIEGAPSYGVMSLLPSYGGLHANVPEGVGRQAASDTLGYWFGQTGGNLRDALAIYNGGPGNPNYGYADQVLATAGGSAPAAAGCGFWDLGCFLRNPLGALGTWLRGCTPDPQNPMQCASTSTTGPGGAAGAECGFGDVGCYLSRAIATWWEGSSTRVIVFTVAVLAALIALFALFQKVPTEIAVRGLSLPKVKVRT